MSNLLQTIENCLGVEGCFGKIYGPIAPIAFPSKGRDVKVMVVTEQPVLERKNIDHLKNALRNGAKNRLAWRLGHLLGDGFIGSVEREDGTFYWTHFIKCSGNFRPRKSGFNAAACANTHLIKEIENLKPHLLISVGGQCGSWLLRHAGVNRDWRECVVSQLRRGKIETLTIESIGVKDMKTIFLIHPAERSGLGWFIDLEFQSLVRKEIEAALG